MSLFKTLHDLVLEEDPNTPPPSNPAQVVPIVPVKASGIPGIPGIPGVSMPSQPIANVPTTTSMPIGTNVSADANLTATYVGKLREKFGTSVFNSILTQFSSTMESLSEAIPEEGNRFRASLKVLGKQSGVSPEQLTEAYNSLLAVLDTEATKFKGSVEKQRSSEVDAREQQVQSINSQIEAKNKEIQTLMGQRDGIATDIVEAKTKLGAIVVSFEGAVTALHSEVSDSIQKLRIYFPATSTAKK